MPRRGPRGGCDMSATADFGHQSQHTAIEALNDAVLEVTDLMSPPCLMAGSANPALAVKVAHRVNVEMLERSIERFPDGETYGRLGSSVRGRDAYIIQPTCAPVNDKPFDRLLVIDNLNRASACHVAAIST